MKTFLHRFGPILAIIACLCLCLTIPGHAQTRPDTGPVISQSADIGPTANLCACPCCPDNCGTDCCCGCCDLIQPCKAVNQAGCPCGNCALIVKPCAAADPFPYIEGSLSVTHALNPDNWRLEDKSTAFGLDLKIGNLLGPVAFVGDASYSVSAANPFSVNDHWSAGLEVPLDKRLTIFAQYQDGFRGFSLYDNRVLLGAKLKFGGG